MKKNTEGAQGCALVQWASFHPVCKKFLIHIANGGSRNIIEARNLKLQGVKKGVSDYFLAYPNKLYHGLWIELKRAKPSRSIISREQKEWIELMNQCGYQAKVAYGWQEAMKIIEDYLSDAN